MAMINGLGGAFIFSPNPRRLVDWYTAHLGLAFESDEEGQTSWLIFSALDPGNPNQKFETVFSIMKGESSLSRPVPEIEPESMYGDQPYMLNLRTGDLDGLLISLENQGVKVIQRAEMVYGKFAWVRDGDGNRLELYQPGSEEQDPSA